MGLQVSSVAFPLRENVESRGATSLDHEGRKTTLRRIRRHSSCGPSHRGARAVVACAKTDGPPPARCAGCLERAERVRTVDEAEIFDQTEVWVRVAETCPSHSRREEHAPGLRRFYLEASECRGLWKRLLVSCGLLARDYVEILTGILSLQLIAHAVGSRLDRPIDKPRYLQKVVS